MLYKNGYLKIFTIRIEVNYMSAAKNKIIILLSILIIVNTALAAKAKNIIIMVADGAGFNTWKAASMYEGKVGSQVYDGAGWQKFACSTYPLNLSNTPTNNTAQDPSVVYNPTKAWDGLTNGYNFLKTTYTDSAAAATALASGNKTYNNAINWSNTDKPLETISDKAKKMGKKVGIITTVPWSHATPAGLGNAHNVSRNNYADIANEMLNSSTIDVIMGAGNPEFDNNGQTHTSGSDYVGGAETWTKLKNGTHSGGWSLIQSKNDFEAVANGTYNGGKLPSRLVGTVQAETTVQQARSGSNYSTAFADPFNSNVPTLETMTKAAINVLDDNPKGFFLLIEGGAVDWANHANQAGRMIEEQISFNKSVDAVVKWVNTNSSWNDTLLIITADHETGFIWGPNSNTAAFDPIVNNGTGEMPGLRYNSGSHTNSLVPMYAIGAGSELFAGLVDGTDPVYGQYIDNTDINKVMNTVVPEPTTITLLAIGTFLISARRKR
jgi:alkaline phosphatase